MSPSRSRGFSADTEALTHHGWVTLDRLIYLDEVATRSQEGRFLWQQPLQPSRSLA